MSAPESTVLRLTGRDALDVIQRISSQRLEDLAAGSARTTLFCDFRGRLLHRAVVARTSDGAIWLLRDDAPGATLSAYVDRHVFREDLRIEDQSAAWRVWAEWSDDDADTVEEADGAPVTVPEGHGFRLRLAAADTAPRPDPARLERERIARGRPRHGHEISDAFNPYEVGCADEVHLSKGCYTGQEALQRLITYASVRRRPVQVRGHGVTPRAPRDLVWASGPAGRLTSAAPAEPANTWVAIAIVRRDALAGDAEAPPLFHLEDGPVIDACVAFPERLPLGRVPAG